MLKVKCYSGYKSNERPVAFSLHNRDYEVKEIVDQWYGEESVYFKVEADDGNIYLLKYDEGQDQWDLVFYQNPRRLKDVLPSQNSEFQSFPQTVTRIADSERMTPLN